VNRKKKQKEKQRRTKKGGKKQQNIEFIILVIITISIPNPLPTYKYITSKQHSCVQGTLQECRSIQSGASGLPYYCTPLVCVPAVLGALTVCLHIMKIKINFGRTVRRSYAVRGDIRPGVWFPSQGGIFQKKKSRILTKKKKERERKWPS